MLPRFLADASPLSPDLLRMTAFLLTLAIFALWWMIGVALLALVRADTGSLRIALTAPALGACTTLLPTFMLSHAGLAVEHFATPLTIGLVVVAGVILVRRRPRLPMSVAPVIVISVLGLLLSAWPIFEFGFHWLANANDDMANYTLSAQQLVHHSLLAPFDFTGFVRGVNYETALTGLHQDGTRPGTDLLLALLSSTTGRLPYEVFMPLALALNLCCVCAVGAFVMQATSRWWAASVAAALLALSPLATFGVLQQLIAQVAGLAFGIALFALLMSSELHRGRGRRIADAIPIGVLLAGLLISYIELSTVLALAYGLYLVVLAVRRELARSIVWRLWIPALVVVVVVLGGYLPTELTFVSHQATSGSQGTAHVLPIFGYALRPTALPGVLGLQMLRPLTGAPNLNLSIAVAAAVLILILIGSLISLRRAVGAAIVLVAFACLAALLAIRSSDFGMFKLYMYAQPFVAALVAVWLATAGRRVLALAVVPVLVVCIAQLSTLRSYVEASRNPVELMHASAPSLMPAFRQIVAGTSGPIVAPSDSPTLTKLEAESARGRQIFFPGTVLFLNLMTTKSEGKHASYLKHVAVKQQYFDLHATSGPRLNEFEETSGETQSIGMAQCQLVMPTGSQMILNRHQLPEGAPSLFSTPCRSARNLLELVSSKLGRAFYLSNVRRVVSLYQLEFDPFFPGHTFSGFGRYALLRVLGPTQNARLELEVTKTVRNEGPEHLPPASVVGARRTPLALIGRGSARVYSKPLRPQVIAGQPYVLLDMGEFGTLGAYPHPGLQGLYGTSVPIEPRVLTSHVRNVSLVSEAEYARLQPPRSVSRFPADLESESLEYSGIYEDGWIGEASYAVLAGGSATDLVLRAAVPQGAGKHLEVLVNGHVLASRAVVPGPVDLRVRLPASRAPRRVELRFAATIRLQGADGRTAAALLSFLGLSPPA
jgi:hypothetical protein